jgi:ribosomal protein S18 acetylase RimI-like enzyme
MPGKREEISIRPACLGDVEAVTEMCNTWALGIRGTRPYDARHGRVQWQMPGYELETDSRVAVSRDGAVVGYASAWDREEPHVRVGGFVRIHPDVADPDLENALFDWLEQRAAEAIDKAPHDARVALSTSSFDEDSHRNEFLERRGYRVVRHFVQLRIDMLEAPEDPVWPPGIEIRPFDREEHLLPLAHAMRDAFRDHWGHVEGSLEQELEAWRHHTQGNPRFDPGTWHVAWSGAQAAGAVLGTAERPEAVDVAYIHSVAVRPAYRGKGIAKALLTHAFGDFYRRGKTRVDLHVDSESPTGALQLYQSVGMEPMWRDRTYELVLRAGRDIAFRGDDADR